MDPATISMSYRKVSAKAMSSTVAINSIQNLESLQDHFYYLIPGENWISWKFPPGVFLIHTIWKQELQGDPIYPCTVFGYPPQMINSRRKEFSIFGLATQRLYIPGEPPWARQQKLFILSVCKIPVCFCSSACARCNDVSANQQILDLWQLLLNGNRFRPFQDCVFSRVHNIGENSHILCFWTQIQLLPSAQLPFQLTKWNFFVSVFCQKIFQIFDHLNSFPGQGDRLSEKVNPFIIFILNQPVKQRQLCKRTKNEFCLEAVA